MNCKNFLSTAPLFFLLGTSPLQAEEDPVYRVFLNAPIFFSADSPHGNTPGNEEDDDQGNPSDPGDDSDPEDEGNPGDENPGVLNFSYPTQSLQLRVATAMSPLIPSLGGVGPYSFSIESGSLPNGINLLSNGRISGTPLSAGLGGANVLATDAGSAEGRSNVSWTVYPELIISTPTQINARAGSPFGVNPSLQNGIGDVTWSAGAGSYPSGVSVNPSTGRISGTVAQTGTYGNLRLQAADDLGSAQSSLFSIVVSEAQINAISNRSGRFNVPFSLSPVFTNPVGPTSWAVASGSLPAGLEIDVATGVVSGTPAENAVGTSSNISLGATDNLGLTTTNAFSITIARPGVSVPSSHSAIRSMASTITPTYSNLVSTGPNTRTYQLVNAPGGMTINSSGNISFTPTTAGTFNNVGVRVNDRDGSWGYAEFNTTVTNPANCTRPWGGNLNHGSSVTAYQNASVPYGQICQSQTRTCTNGTLSGSYTHQSCTVQNPTVGSAYSTSMVALLNGFGIVSTTPVNGSGNTTFNFSFSTYTGQLTFNSQGVLIGGYSISSAPGSVLTHCRDFFQKLNPHLTPTQRQNLWLSGYHASNPVYRSHTLSSVAPSCSGTPAQMGGYSADKRIDLTNYKKY